MKNIKLASEFLELINNAMYEYRSKVEFGGGGTIEQGNYIKLEYYYRNHLFTINVKDIKISDSK